MPFGTGVREKSVAFRLQRPAISGALNLPSHHWI